ACEASNPQIAWFFFDGQTQALEKLLLRPYH
ncbi:MAG: hypothetical protein RI968_666, partial [Pseudomonadota bacterium]